jgi:hypothetical protein
VNPAAVPRPNTEHCLTTKPANRRKDNKRDEHKPAKIVSSAKKQRRDENNAREASVGNLQERIGDRRRRKSATRSVRVSALVVSPCAHASLLV